MCFATRLVWTMLLSALLGAGPARADEAGDQYAVAAGHYAQGRWQLAADEFQVFLDAYSEHARAAQALFFRGEALVQLGRATEAQACFTALVERSPSGPLAAQALFRRAEAAYVAGQLKPAREQLEHFLAAYPDHELDAYALPYLAEVLLEQHDAEAARKLFAKALDLYPDAPLAGDCRLGLGKADEALGRLDEARRAFGELAAADGALADQARFQLGVLENSAGEYDAALQAFAHFEKRSDNPLYDRALLGRAWAHFKLQHFAAAETDLTGLTERDPAQLEAQYWLGLVRAADKRWADAVEPLAAVERAADDPNRVQQCRAALAICYAHSGQLPRARQTYAAFEQQQPPAALWSSTTYQVAEAAFSHDAQWAGELFGALSKNAAADYVAKGLSGLAWCQFRSSDTAASAVTFERLLAEHPDDPLAPEAALVRGQALEKLDRADPALAMYRLVIDKYPQSRQVSQALWHAARLEHRLARLAAAEELYRRLADERPPFARYDALLYQWSRALGELGNHERAAELLERLRRDWPASEFVAAATLQLAEQALKARQFDRAGTLAGEIVAREPAAKNLPQALYLQGRVALECGQWSQVRSPLERLVSQFPESGLVMPARYWMAEARYREPSYEQAAEEFAALDRDAAGRDEPWLAMLPLRHAQSLAQLNQWAEALEIARGIENRYPNFDQQYEADYVVGRALAARAEFAQAREAYARVLRSPQGGKTETAALAQWMIGETYFHQENYEAAIAAYLRLDILYAFPKWQAGALLQAGKCQETLGQWQQAAETYARLIKNYPESEFTPEAKRRFSVAEQRGSRRS